MRDAQELMQIMESENPDFEFIKKRFIGLCLQAKDLKSAISQYCEIKYDTDIIDRISNNYENWVFIN